MKTQIDNLVLEHLKRIQQEQSQAHERDSEILVRLGRIESAISRVARDESQTYAELVEDRHSVDRQRERVCRIERRLEFSVAETPPPPYAP